MYKVHNYINNKVNSMKKYFKSFVAISCLVASTHNSDASSFSKMGLGFLGAASVTTFSVWNTYASSINGVQPTINTQQKKCDRTADALRVVNQPLSPEASQIALNECLKINPTLPENKAVFLGENVKTSREWFQLVTALAEQKKVHPCILSDHHREYDAALKRILPENCYNALVEANIYEPLSPHVLMALAIIAKD